MRTKRASVETLKPTGKIGFVIGSLMRGGAEMHLVQLMPVLKERGWDVSVFLIGPSGPVAKDFQKAGISVAPRQSVRVYQWLPVWLRRATRFALLSPKFLYYAWHHRSGIIHFFLPEAFIVGGLLTFPWHRRLVMSRRGQTTYRAKYPQSVTTLERFLQRRLSLALGNSARIVDDLLKDGIRKDRIRLIYNGLTPERLEPPNAERDKLRTELGISEDCLVFVVLANLFPYKGHADLLTALGELKAANRLPPDWKLLLIGRNISVTGTELLPNDKSSYKAVLEKQCAGLGLSDHVRFMGEREDAPALLRSANIGVFPSHEEGFSNALLEQMAAGLAIVASDVGGNKEALDAGRVGIIVPPHSPTRLARAIGELIDSVDARNSLGKAARDRALKHYTMAKCADKYEEAYKELL